MALSAQIGYIVPLISMLQLNSEIIKKVDCYMLGIHTMKHYNKQLFNLGFAGKTLQHKRYHESSNIQGWIHDAPHVQPLATMSTSCRLTFCYFLWSTVTAAEVIANKQKINSLWNWPCFYCEFSKRLVNVLPFMKLRNTNNYLPCANTRSTQHTTTESIHKWQTSNMSLRQALLKQ